MSKSDIRATALKRRRETENREEKSVIICDRVTKLDAYKNAKVVACYMPIGSEVDTGFLIKHALWRGKKIVLPKTEGDRMRFIEHKGTDALICGNFGIKEPAEGAEVLPQQIDLFIIPGVAFDKEGNRIGYGKGYYDKYLEKISKTKIGIAFSSQVFDFIASEQNDIKMDAVVTEDTDEACDKDTNNNYCRHNSGKRIP